MVWGQVVAAAPPATRYLRLSLTAQDTTPWARTFFYFPTTMLTGVDHKLNRKYCKRLGWIYWKQIHRLSISGHFRPQGWSYLEFAQNEFFKCNNLPRYCASQMLLTPHLTICRRPFENNLAVGTRYESSRNPQSSRHLFSLLQAFNNQSRHLFSFLQTFNDQSCHLLSFFQTKWPIRQVKSKSGIKWPQDRGPYLQNLLLLLHHW